MGKNKEEKVNELLERLSPNEKIEEIGHFSGVFNIAIFFAVAIATLIIARIFSDKFMIVILLNILGMWMMVDAARVFYDVSNSCIVATNKRIYGIAGGKEFNLYYGQIKQMGLNKILFLDSGDPRTSIVIRNLKNRYEIHEIIVRNKK